MEREALRRLIRRKLAEGTLPRERAARVWAGRGRGEQCDACEETIASGQFLIEALRQEGPSLHFHLECFYFWDALRRTPGGAEPASEG
ncbi:MAG TPA: hypothetical protein VNO23_06315 [Candidatus Binatia bacterium]|nr:hypothetical protein [Candidatus Binatia bacterium]